MALSNSHLNVFKGFEKRYNYYNNKYEDYVGDYECTKTADIDHAYRTGNTVSYKAPAAGWTPIELDLDNDGTNEKWHIHHASERLKRAEEIPQYKKGNCKSGELYAKVGDGRIDAANQALITSNLLYQRDYVLYLHQIEIEPVNTAIELANTEYELSEEKKTTYQSSSTVHWEALAYPADGQIERAKYDNNVVSSWDYDERGRTTLIKAGKTGQFDELQKMVFNYDRVGNLLSRNDITNDLKETFSYDVLNRVKDSTLQGTAATAYQQVGLDNQSFSYDAIGNITNKSDVGIYTYGQNGTGVHAVTSTSGAITTTFSYDANGNQLTGHGRSMDWSIFNKPIKITKNGSENRFAYGPERQMVTQFEQVGDKSRYTRYIGGRYEEITFNQTTEAVHHLKVAGHTVAVLKTQPQLNNPDITLPIVNSTHYLHQDHLESVVMITNANGDVVEKNHYDAFGKKRTGVIEPNAAPLMAGIWPVTDRSFTNHMELLGVGLFHMKGRVYDATFGRFLSADPHIQSPLNSQSLNRYSYVQNNPLSLTDPTGYFWSKLKKLFKKILKAIKKIVKKIVAIVKKVVKAVYEISKYPRMKIHRWAKRNSSFYAKYYRQIAAIAVSIIVPAAISAVAAGAAAGSALATFAANSIAVGAVTGFTAGFVATGSLKGALIGGLTGAAFGAVGKLFRNPGGLASRLGWVKEVGHIGVAGKAVVTGIGRVVQSAAHGMIGGLSSRLSGGSFSKGILTGFVNKLATPSLVSIAGNNQALVIAGSGLLAGGVSALAGGSFGDGASLGVMATVLNNYQGVIKGAKEIFGAIKANSKALWHYYAGNGQKNVFSGSEWSEIKAGGINENGDFNDHPTHSEVLGTATVYTDDQGGVTGIYDEYDFDPKGPGGRSPVGEALTRTFEHLNVTADTALPAIPFLDLKNPRQSYVNCYGSGC